MKKEEILKKICKKLTKQSERFDYELSGNGRVVGIFKKGEDITNDMIQIWEFIFSHDFLKAFFYVDESDVFYKQRLDTWQWHAQQMVLEKDPLKYLEKFL